MRKYNFDKVVDRKGSGAVKVDGLEKAYGSSDLIPLWVADMDFETPDFIMDALRTRLEHPVLGYTLVPESYWESIIKWQDRRNGWKIAREWITYIPGIVKGIGMAVNVFTKPGDKIIIQPPVYHPFRIVPEENGREIVFNPLMRTEEGYEMDFEHLESIIDGCRMLILSNPHNPAGIAWSKESLCRLSEICERHGIIVISDEIHSDMPLFGHRHIPFATVSDQAKKISITFAAPSKTFNIAGVVSSYAIVPDDSLRARFFGWLEASEMNAPSLFAPIATQAAYTHGDGWLEQMLAYLEGNIRFVEKFCEENIPAIHPMRPQASFLVWLDCRGLGLDHDSLVRLFVKDASLALNDGEIFGPGGEGYMRLNVGTDRGTLEIAMKALHKAIIAP